VPPLRQLHEDIPLLVAHFTRRYCTEQQLQPKRVSHESMKYLMSYDWPGNIRQLQNAVEMAVTLSGDRDLLELGDFPVVARNAPGPPSSEAVEIPEDGIHFNTVVSDLEKRLILQSLQASGGNKKKAASLLHLKRTTFVEKLRRMGMDTPADNVMDMQSPSEADS
jgi:DNA-binding NtrC family response regulator